MPTTVEAGHNLGLKHLIEPGGDLSATQFRQNIDRIKTAANNLVESSLEPGCINTRHLAMGKGATPDGMWKSIFHTDSDASGSTVLPLTVANSTSWGVAWKCTFGGGGENSVPNAPLFITVRMKVQDTNSSLVNFPRYHFKLQAVAPTGGTLIDVTWTGRSGLSASTERSMTLVPSNDISTANGAAIRQIVLATPWEPYKHTTDPLTSMELALATKVTNYAGSGSASGSTLIIQTADVRVVGIRR